MTRRSLPGNAGLAAFGAGITLRDWKPMAVLTVCSGSSARLRRTGADTAAPSPRLSLPSVPGHGGLTAP